MASALSITSAVPDPALLDLPWDLPLEVWPDEYIAALPKGISRHLVRFVHLGGYVIAVKETSAELAKREYELLRTLQRLDIPCVEPVAVITNRAADDGEELAPALVTRHLRFSLPYRALYSQSLRPDTATRLVDALAVLLARLHVIGFFWGDVSLSNTLFRRDAGAFAAYLVDAETGKLYDGGLSNGQRENDLEIARVNIAGELLDLQAGGRLDEDDRSGRDRRRHRHRVPQPVDGADRRRVVPAVGALAHQPARRAAQRPRIRHRRALDQPGRRRHPGAHPAQGGGCRPPLPSAAAADRARRRREPGADGC